MKYLEVMAAFNTMKTKLLATSLINQHIPQLHPIDQESYFKDFRFFNPLLTAKENVNLKLGVAKVLKYDNTIVGGNITYNILYKETVYHPKDGKFILQAEFSPLGITLYNQPTTYRYKFERTHFIKREYVDKVLMSKQQFDYSPFFFKEAYSYLMNNNISSFGQYVAMVTAETKDLLAFKFRRGVAVPTSFLEFIQEPGPYAVQLTEEGFNVWPG